MGDKDCGGCGGKGALVEESGIRERSTKGNTHRECFMQSHWLGI